MPTLQEILQDQQLPANANSATGKKVKFLIVESVPCDTNYQPRQIHATQQAIRGRFGVGEF
jgi:hypothetical protein